MSTLPTVPVGGMRARRELDDLHDGDALAIGRYFHAPSRAVVVSLTMAGLLMYGAMIVSGGSLAARIGAIAVTFVTVVLGAMYRWYRFVVDELGGDRRLAWALFVASNARGALAIPHANEAQQVAIGRSVIDIACKRARAAQLKG
jgi:hypothetical protein